MQIQVTPGSQLPIDVWSIIFSYLPTKQRRDDIINYSLVCRDWYTITFYFLRERATLNSASLFGSFCSSIAQENPGSGLCLSLCLRTLRGTLYFRLIHSSDSLDYFTTGIVFILTRLLVVAAAVAQYDFPITRLFNHIFDHISHANPCKLYRALHTRMLNVFCYSLIPYILQLCPRSSQHF